MAIPIPPNVIPTPDPGPARYGVFAVAPPDTLPPRARQSGTLYDAVGCGTARGYPVDCPPTLTKVIDPNTAEQATIPFVVYASLVCGSAGYTSDYLATKVRRKLQAVEQTGVEEALWSGAIQGVTLGSSPTLVGAVAGFHTTLTAATSLAAGVGALEDFAAATYGYRPIIHAETRIAALAGKDRLIDRDGTVLRTPLGSAWSFGGGYPGTSPAGAAPAAGHAWLYASGQVSLWRSPDVFVAPPDSALNRTTNQYNLFAEREWLAAIDCFVAAIDVTL